MELVKKAQVFMEQGQYYTLYNDSSHLIMLKYAAGQGTNNQIEF